MRRLLFAALIAAPLLAAAGVPEPDGFRMDNYNAPVPDVLAGAGVVDAKALSAAMAAGATAVDVMPAARRPPTLPVDRPWMPPPRMDIPGSLWWPELGRGAISQAQDAWFRARLSEVTGGKLDKPVAFYAVSATLFISRGSFWRSNNSHSGSWPVMSTESGWLALPAPTGRSCHRGDRQLVPLRPQAVMRRHVVIGAVHPVAVVERLPAGRAGAGGRPSSAAELRPWKLYGAGSPARSVNSGARSTVGDRGCSPLTPPAAASARGSEAASACAAIPRT